MRRGRRDDSHSSQPAQRKRWGQKEVDIQTARDKIVPRMQNCLIAELEQPEDPAGPLYMDCIAESSHGKRHRILSSKESCACSYAWDFIVASPLMWHETLDSG